MPRVRGPLGGGRSLGGGRVRVYGCSPGCLLLSLGLSVFITLLLNGCLNVVGG